MSGVILIWVLTPDFIILIVFHCKSSSPTHLLEMFRMGSGSSSQLLLRFDLPSGSVTANLLLHLDCCRVLYIIVICFILVTLFICPYSKSLEFERESLGGGLLISSLLRFDRLSDVLFLTNLNEKWKYTHLRSKICRICTVMWFEDICIRPYPCPKIRLRAIIIGGGRDVRSLNLNNPLSPPFLPNCFLFSSPVNSVSTRRSFLCPFRSLAPSAQESRSLRPKYI